MGYFSAGIALGSAPDWNLLRHLPINLGMRGYAHRNGNIWLLEFWRPGKGVPEYPFTAGHEFRELQQLPAVPLLSQLTRIEQAIAVENPYGHGWICLAAAVSSVLRLPAFLFAADDDLFDLGCSLSGPEATSLSIDLGTCLLQLRDGRFTLAPYNSSEGEGEAGAFAGDAEALARLEVTQVSPMFLEGGRPLYHNVLIEWPANLGDPEKLLGLGTWDPFATFGDNFACVFEHGDGEQPHGLGQRRAYRMQAWMPSDEELKSQPPAARLLETVRSLAAVRGYQLAPVWSSPKQDICRYAIVDRGVSPPKVLAKTFTTLQRAKAYLASDVGKPVRSAVIVDLLEGTQYEDRPGIEPS